MYLQQIRTLGFTIIKSDGHLDGFLEKASPINNINYCWYKL